MPEDFDNAKIARVKELRQYVAKWSPGGCCAVERDEESDYDELVRDVATDLMYDVLGLYECGDTEKTVATIRDYLEIVQTRGNSVPESHKKMVERFGTTDISSDGLLQFMAYTLDHLGLTGHGISLNGAVITEKGRVCLEAFTLYLEVQLYGQTDKNKEEHI